MVALFTADDLGDFLQVDVSTTAAAAVERVVWGWLKVPLGLSERPDPVPDEVFSWAVELGAIAHENPAGLAAYQLGGERSQFSVERRREILDAAASGGGIGTSGGGLRPRGSFPAASCWPDPIRHW